MLLLVFSLLPLSVSAQEEGGATNSSFYLDMEPSFILNYGDGNRLRYIRTDITLRLSTSGTISADVNLHMPLLRHSIIMFLSKQSDERIRDAAQREGLREELLATVKSDLNKVTNSEGVLDLLFTTFIVQQ